MFIWESVDKKDLLVVSENDKEEYDFLLEFILDEVFIIGAVDKTHLLVISENEVELLTNVLPWTPVELAKQYLILLLETVKFWGIDLLTDAEIEIKSELEDLKIKCCLEPFNLFIYHLIKLLSREKKLLAITLKVGDLLTLGFLCTFKSPAKLGKELFVCKSCFQKWCIE